jgi:hypothetical protein
MSDTELRMGIQKTVAARKVSRPRREAIAALSTCRAAWPTKQ